MRKLKKNKIKSQKQRKELAGHHRGKEQSKNSTGLSGYCDNCSQQKKSASIKCLEMTHFKSNFKEPDTTCTVQTGIHP